MWVLHLQCCVPSMTDQPTRESSLRLQWEPTWKKSPLMRLNLKWRSRRVTLTLESKLESGFRISEHQPLPSFWKNKSSTRKVLDQVSSQNTQKEDKQVSTKEGLHKDSDKSEGTDATMHQVYGVMARAGPERRLLDWGASVHMTGMKSLLKDYKEVTTTTRTVANGDVLRVEVVENIYFKTEHGYVTCTGVLRVPVHLPL